MTATLLIIDLQQEFTRRTLAGRPRSTPGAETRAAAVLAAFRAAGRPVLHIHHDDPDPASGFRLDKPTGAVMPEVAPLAGALRFEMLDEPHPLPGLTRSFHKSKGSAIRRQRAKTLFYPRDGNRKRRLRHVQMLCRTRKAASFGNGDDVFILSKADI